jgi:hypothetical protein
MLNQDAAPEKQTVVNLREVPNAKPTIIDCNKESSVPSDWELRVHIRRGMIEWDPSKIGLLEKALHKFEKEGKVTLHEFFKLLMGDLSIMVMNGDMADFFVEHRDQYPEEWKKKHVFFWGSIYENSEKNLYVRYLTWDDGYGLLERTRSFNATWTPEDHSAIHMLEPPAVVAVAVPAEPIDTVK